jgi:UDP-N-acetylmuramoyl-tripeptide--D-alanyl-D-alanine ligase
MAYSIDTRTLQPGDIFIPVKGPNFDGHAFIAEANRKGASQILDVDLGVFAREHRLKYKIPVIAITGSAGKTTTKDMLAAVLGQKFKLVKSLENQNNEVGVPLTLLRIEPTTEIAIVEMAMRGLGQIEYLAQLAEPTHAIITNIGYAHLELLKTREAIALAKSEVIRQGMKIFLNRHDDFFEFLKEQGTAKHAIVEAFDYPKVTDANAAAVRAVAKDLGLTNKEVDTGLAQYQSSAHRLKTIQKNGITIIDDSYNSNPDAVRFALNILRETPAKRRIAVLGDMKELGDAAAQLHKAISVKGIDLVFTYGDLAKKISHTKNFTTAEAEKLISTLQVIMRPGDAILIKGSRSMKMESIVSGISQEK